MLIQPTYKIVLLFCVLISFVCMYVFCFLRSNVHDIFCVLDITIKKTIPRWIHIENHTHFFCCYFICLWYSCAYIHVCFLYVMLTVS